MNIKLEQGSLHLRKDRTLRLSDARGTRVEVCRGSLWVTQDRDLNDYVLESGGSLTLDRDGEAILYALEGSDFELADARAQQKRGGAAGLLEFAADAADKWLGTHLGPRSAANLNQNRWESVV